MRPVDVGIRLLLGGLIIALGFTVCRGAFLLWPTTPLDGSVGAFALAALRILGSAVAALLGVGNVIAGAVVLARPSRD